MRESEIRWREKGGDGFLDGSVQLAVVQLGERAEWIGIGRGKQSEKRKKMEGVRDDPMYETILLRLLEC
jgi:hypothetical protein